MGRRDKERRRQGLVFRNFDGHGHLLPAKEVPVTKARQKTLEEVDLYVKTLKEVKAKQGDFLDEVE